MSVIITWVFYIGFFGFAIAGYMQYALVEKKRAEKEYRRNLRQRTQNRIPEDPRMGSGYRTRGAGYGYEGSRGWEIQR